MKKFLKYSFLSFMGLGLFASAMIIILYMWASQDLPGFKKITDYKPPLVTTVYARDGSVLGYFYREMRFLERLDNMPPHLARAFLASEDAAFYEHEGVDIAAIFRAFFKNLKAGTIRQGGSTITQQVIKRLLLTSEKSYERKLKEAILAYRLERYLSKGEILTIYLNQIYLGAGTYGVEAAARVYFGKHVNQLTLAESAVLAGLPQAPSRYNPFRHPEAAKARQRYVLDRMLELRWITQAEYDEALAQELVFKSMADPSWKQGAYYLEEVRRTLIDLLSKENVQAMGFDLDRYGEDAVYESGLHVYTAVDIQHQVAAEQAVKEGLEASTKRRGWQGPVSHLEPGQYEEFLEEQAVQAEVLEPGEWFQVLVTEVKAESAAVRVGKFKGRIPVETMGWARELDPSKAPEHVPDIKDARTILKPGNTVWASVVEVEKQQAEEKKEEASEVKAEAPVSEQPEEITLVKMALEQKPKVQGALVSIEPENGDVVALVGGYSFHESQFNRATQAYRQPGSAFKPFVYSAALDNGFTPATTVLDAPFVYTDYSTGKVWRPENFEGVFYGPTILRTALAKSRNLCTIRVAQRIGVRRIVERAKALGLEPEFPTNLSVSLGSVAVTPINLSQAYTAFARDGSYVEPRIIHSIQNPWREEIYMSEVEEHEAVSPQNAYVIAGMMKEVVRAGTGWRARKLGRPLAGKTGTTNEEMDAWFIGYTPYLLSVVYVGFDKARPMGKFETGSRAASPIWVQYRQAVEANYPVQDFPEPPGIVHVQIDGKTGLLAGPHSEESYFLPFFAGTQPTETAEAAEAQETPSSQQSGEELLKQIF